jgi:hypothetical protein
LHRRRRAIATFGFTLIEDLTVGIIAGCALARHLRHSIRSRGGDILRAAKAR